MENPYSHAPAAGTLTPEQQKIADYELAIGPRSGYYLPKFENYDSGGSKAGWNWPAFFVTTPWYLYRKMWLWGLLNLAAPWILCIILSIVAAATKSPGLVGVLMLVAFIAPWLGFTIFANALYWRHINNVIDGVPRSLADKPDKRTRRIERDGGTGAGAMIGVLFGIVFVFGGILAAIAIPAYQDYTIRAQVTEGLVLSAGAKAAVAEYYAQNEDWAENSATAEFGGATGKYVDSVSIENGSVVVSYGGAANPNLAGKSLILLPGADVNKDIVWSCANHGMPDGVSPAPGPHGTDIPNKYLPSQCRPSSGT